MSNYRNWNEFWAENSVGFELNPLIEEIALGNDSDILDKYPEFSQLHPSHRVALICEGLLSNGLAKFEAQPTAVWLPVDSVEHACGGSNIVPRSRYQMPGAREFDKKPYERAIKRQFRRRLDYIITRSVTLFRAYNFGLVQIEGRGYLGMLQWGVSDSQADLIQKLNDEQGSVWLSADRLK